MVNFIKSSALNTRLFRLLCQEFDDEQIILLFHTEVRWLSRGNMSRVHSLRKEMAEFFERNDRAKSRVFCDKLADKAWIIRLSYLENIFSRLNFLNKSLRGKFTTVIDFIDKIRAFIMKLDLWERKAKDGNLDIFKNVITLLEGEEIKKDIMELVQSHLSCLKEEFKLYFPDLSELDLKLFRNPFIVDVRLIPNNVQEECIEFLNDSTVRNAFETLPLMKFWSRMSQHFPSVAAMAVGGLLMFPGTYLCEQGFSALIYIKNKYRARLCVEPDLRVALSKTEPRIDELVKAKQAQLSH